MLLGTAAELDLDEAAAVPIAGAAQTPAPCSPDSPHRPVFVYKRPGIGCRLFDSRVKNDQLSG